MFALRSSLYAIDNLLLTALPLCCSLPDYCFVLASRWLASFFLVARLLASTVRWLNANYMQLVITCWQLTAQRSLFSIFNLLLINSRALLVVSS